MKATKLSLLVALIIGGAVLTGCKKASDSASQASSQASSNPASSESSKPVESSSSEAEPVYTITESEYLLSKSFFATPALFVNGNITVSNFVNVKIANGKVDFETTASHSKFDIDVSSYNASTKKAIVEEYDIEAGVWYHYHEPEFDLNELYFNTQLYYFTILPETFAELTYSAEEHKYTCPSAMPEVNFELFFENAKLVSCVVKGEIDFVYDFSNYGTTTVEMPTEYQEAAEI